MHTIVPVNSWTNSNEVLHAQPQIDHKNHKKFQTIFEQTPHAYPTFAIITLNIKYLQCQISHNNNNKKNYQKMLFARAI